MENENIQSGSFQIFTVLICEPVGAAHASGQISKLHDWHTARAAATKSPAAGIARCPLKTDKLAGANILLLP
jgi:hypothetical protein